MIDPYVTETKGIYMYLLSGETKHLNIRVFNDKQKRIAYEKQGGVCRLCSPDKIYKIKEMEADHVTAWSKGGKTTDDNCQMLDPKANLEKSNK